MSTLCRVYGIKRDSYNAWKRRGKSLRSYEDEQLFEVISKIFNDSQGYYGSPKITQAMKTLGYRISKKRVARIMQENGLRARRAIIYKNMSGLINFIKSVPNRILEEVAVECDRVWVGDITYLKVNDEWRYLAVVMDKCSRKIIGWSLGEQRTADLTWSAFRQALKNRNPEKGLIFHTDRGIEYRAYSFADKLAKRGIIQSMNRPRRMNDNAHMESFFANFKSEKIHGRPEFTCENALRGMITEYIGFYNNRRLHSSIGYITPDEFERRMN